MLRPVIQTERGQEFRRLGNSDRSPGPGTLRRDVLYLSRPALGRHVRPRSPSDSNHCATARQAKQATETLMSMPLHEFLRRDREDVPAWLNRFQPGDAFDRLGFFSSRVVYYPGSEADGQPVKLFGSTHAAHCFIYVDYGVSRDVLEAELGSATRSWRGYQSVARINLSQHDLLWTRNIEVAHVASHGDPIDRVDPFGFLEVLERDQGLDDRYGARSLAILFLGIDGIETYRGLFCQDSRTQPPFAVVVVDHGFGGNYDRFGGGGLLEAYAERYQVFPRWLLVGEQTDAWKGYARVPMVDGENGGRHGERRFLYERT